MDHLDRRGLVDAQHPVIVEVALPHAPVGEGDAGEQGRGQAEDQPALDLLLHGAGIGGDPAVDRRHDAAQVDVAGVGHARLDHGGDVAAERLLHDHSAPSAIGQARAPAGGLRDTVQHGARARNLAQQVAPVVHRILAGGVGQLVDEALHHEDGVGRTHPAPPGDDEARRRTPLDVVDLHVRESAVDRVLRLLDGVGVHSVRPHAGRSETGGDGGGGDAVTPGDGPAVGVQTGGDPVDIGGAVAIVLDVLFARPDQLDRIGAGLGDRRRLLDVVGLQLAAEGAADQLVVDGDPLGRDPQHLGRGLLRHGGDLGAAPDLRRPVRLDLDHRGLGLHRRVREERLAVDRLDPGVRVREGLLHIAGLMGQGGRSLARSLVEVGPQGLRAHRRVRPFVPADREGVEAGLGRPEVLADHRDRVGQLDHLQHPRDGQRRALVHRSEAAAEHRAGRGGGEFHPRHDDVDAVDRRAVGLGGGVDPLDRTADQLELGRRLQRHLLGRGLARSGLDQLAVGGGAPARRMGDGGAGGLALGRVHAPPARRRLDQHGARRRPGTPQRLPGAAGGGRAPRPLKLQQRLFVQGFVGRGWDDLHLVQAHLQLLGDEHAFAGVDALAHLHVGDDEADPVVRADADEGVGGEAGEARAPDRVHLLVRDRLRAGGVHPPVGSFLRPGPARAEGEAQHQAAAEHEPAAV